MGSIQFPNLVPPIATVDRVEGIDDTVVATASDVEIFGNGFQAGTISTISFLRMIVSSVSYLLGFGAESPSVGPSVSYLKIYKDFPKTAQRRIV